MECREQHSQETELRTCDFWWKTGLEEWESQGIRAFPGEACECPTPLSGPGPWEFQTRAPHTSVASVPALALGAPTLKPGGCPYLALLVPPSAGFLRVVLSSASC